MNEEQVRMRDLLEGRKNTRRSRTRRKQDKKRSGQEGSWIRRKEQSQEQEKEKEKIVLMT
jgi:hypothetical protein